MSTDMATRGLFEPWDALDAAKTTCQIAGKLLRNNTWGRNRLDDYHHTTSGDGIAIHPSHPNQPRSGIHSSPEGGSIQQLRTGIHDISSE